MFNEMTSKWQVKKISNSRCYEVPRVYLMFIEEKPMMFAQRIHKAIEFRDECEKCLRFEAVVDHISLSHIPKTPQRIRDRVRDSLLHHRRFNEKTYKMGWIELFEWEYCMLYQRMQAREEFLKFVKMEPHSSFTSIQLPTMDKKLENVSRLPSLLCRLGRNYCAAQKSSTTKMTFEQSRKDFQRMWLYCCPQAIKIMDIVNNNCDSVTRMSLFHIQTLSSMNEMMRVIFNLNEFVDAHKRKLLEISSFFQKEWIEFIVEKIKFCLHYSEPLKVGRRGWFDTEVRDWYVFKNSKLFRLIELVKIRMQIALRDAVRFSTRAFVKQLCEPCEKLLTLTENFVWGNNLVSSQFHSSQPIFWLEIVFDESNEPIFSTHNLDDFRVNIVKIFESTILASHEVPHFDPYLVEALKFDQSLRLSSIGIHDEEIQSHMQQLEMCYRVCLRPLKAYVREFKRFSEFREMSVGDFMDRMEKLSGSMVQKEMARQLQSIDEIRQTVPTSIVIGPFEVRVERIREELIVKHKTLHESLLKMFIKRIETSLSEINLEFVSIHNKLTRDVESVEEIVATRNWIPSIEEEVEKLSKRLDDISFDDIDILGELFIPLRNEIFALYVQNRLMPLNIMSSMEEVEARLTFEFEQFRKLQMTHQVNFLEKIEYLEKEVEIYSATKHADDKVGNIEKLWNITDDLRKFGEMLNNRQKIFNQPEIDMTPMYILVERLAPYHDFFVTTSHFLQSMKKWTKTLPLSKVDVSIFEEEMKRCENVVNESRKHFDGDEEMTILIEKTSSMAVEDARTMLDILHDLTNPDLDKEHFELMSKKFSSAITLSPELTLHSFALQGRFKLNEKDKARIIRDVSQAATSARITRDKEKEETERKFKEEVEIMKKKKSRLAARKDI